EADAVIRHAGLGEVVRPDALAPLPGAHLAPPVGGDGGGLLVLGALEQARLEHTHGLRPVLDLRALVLAGHHEPGGDVGDAHGRVGRVDTLAAGAGRAIDVHADVPLVNLHIHVLRLGEHRHRHRGRVNAAARLGGGHALHPVHPALELEPAPRALALDEEDDLLVAAHTGDVAVH